METKRSLVKELAVLIHLARCPFNYDGSGVCKLFSGKDYERGKEHCGPQGYLVKARKLLRLCGGDGDLAKEVIKVLFG